MFFFIRKSIKKNEEIYRQVTKQYNKQGTAQYIYNLPLCKGGESRKLYLLLMHKEIWKIHKELVTVVTWE